MLIHCLGYYNKLIVNERNNVCGGCGLKIMSISMWSEAIIIGPWTQLGPPLITYACLWPGLLHNKLIVSKEIMCAEHDV